MGEYANYALANYARHGMRVDPNYKPRKRPKIACPVCDKMVEKTEGLEAHMKSKH